MKSILLACAAAVLGAATAQAAPWDAAFTAALPPEAMADAAVDAHPDVQRARSNLDLARAERRQLAAGPEFNVGGYASNRNVNQGGGFAEYGLEMSRPVRLPGKAAADRRTGEMGVRAADDEIADARHKAGLELSDAWYGWIEASGAVALDRETEGAYRQDLQAVRRRFELQDAALVEVEQAEAALASAAARRTQSEGQLETVRLALLRTFPDLRLPAHAPALPAPPPLDPPASAWADITVQASHEIAIAEARAEQAEAVARRARLERTPDPTIGVRALSEFGGREKSLGVFFSTPIGGARRSAAADVESARANGARIELAKVRRRAAALGEYNAALSDNTRSAWLSADRAVQASDASARRITRGYELGEHDLAATLVANRQLYDAKRAEIAARAAAWRALTHLRLDAHDLWHESEPQD